MSGAAPAAAGQEPKIGEPFIPYRLFKGAFWRFAEAISRYRGLPHGEKQALACLARFAGEDGACFPSVGRLARELGRSQCQARRYLRGLERKGFLKPDRKNRHYYANGAGGTCFYVFLWHSAFDGDVGAPRTRKSTPPPLASLPGVTPSIFARERKPILKTQRDLKERASQPATVAEARRPSLLEGETRANTRATEQNREAVKTFLMKKLGNKVPGVPGNKVVNDTIANLGAASLEDLGTIIDERYADIEGYGLVPMLARDASERASTKADRAPLSEAEKFAERYYAKTKAAGF
jgi:hypothetical protein